MSTPPHPRQAHDAPLARGLALVAFAAVAGLLSIAAIPILAELGKKGPALAVLCVGLAAVLYLWRRPREVLLFVWVMSLTYNRQFYVMESPFGDNPAFGVYWMVSDLFLVALLGLWVWEAVVLKRPQHGVGAIVWPWFAPFVAVAALSLVDAREPLWGLSDLLRLVKLSLVLLYFRFNVRQREWWTIVAGLGVALVLQSSFGLLEIVSGRTGIMWLFGGGFDAASKLGITTVFGGWTRATGTMGHPPYLATFMILVIPIFLSLALADSSGRLRVLFIAIAGIGLLGLACTLSRLPIVIMLGQVGMLLLIVFVFGMTRMKRVLGILATGALVASLLSIALADRIHGRITGDFDDSVSTRFEEYTVALRMLGDHPVVGIGLNNYAAHMRQYDSGTSWGIGWRWHRAAIDVVRMRLLAGPLNGFLYVATVTGILGLLCFLLYCIGSVVLAVRACAATSGLARAASLGMLVGFLGLFLQQSLSYSIWIDPVIATWTVLFGLCARASTIGPQRTEPGGEHHASP